MGLHVKQLFALLLVMTVFFLLVSVYSCGLYYGKEGEFQPSKKHYIVYNVNCKIPNFAPFHESKYLRVAPRKICPSNIDFTHQKANKLLVNITGLMIFCNGTLKHCEYKDIIRVDDNHIKYSPATKFNGDVTVTSEFIRVKCFCSDGGKVYTNFHAFVQPRKNSSFQNASSKTSANMLNVVMIGLDSISRLNSHRQLSGTRTFLLTKLHALELFGYNIIGDSTFFNIMALLFGKYHYDIGWTLNSTERFDEYDQLLNTFRQKGYKTMYVEDAPDMPIFSHLLQGFNKPPTDYHFRPLAKAIRNEKILSKDHMCMRGRLYTTVILNYVHDFLKLYESEKHFVFNFNSYPSHDQLNSAGRVDYALREFLAKIHSEQLLNNTLLFLFADHGIRLGKFRETYMGKLEERLPMMYIVPPKWLPVTFPNLWGHLKNNRHKLTTPFDIHETLLSVFNLSEFEGQLSKIDLNARGISLFASVPENTACGAATIKAHWCACQQIKQLPTNDNTVVKVATLIVAYINKMLQPEKKCASLKLHHINAADISISNNKIMMRRTCKNRYRLETCKLHGESHVLPYSYQLIVITVPGFAVFEATVDYHAQENSIKMRGDLSRINLYGNQSMCTSRLDLKKYCYCK